MVIIYHPLPPHIGLRPVVAMTENRDHNRTNDSLGPAGNANGKTRLSFDKQHDQPPSKLYYVVCVAERRLPIAMTLNDASSHILITFTGERVRQFGTNNIDKVKHI